MIIMENEVTDATQEMLVDLHLVMFVSFGLQQKDCFKCKSTSIFCVVSVTVFCIMTQLVLKLLATSRRCQNLKSVARRLPKLKPIKMFPRSY